MENAFLVSKPEKISTKLLHFREKRFGSKIFAWYCVTRLAINLCFESKSCVGWQPVLLMTLLTKPAICYKLVILWIIWREGECARDLDKPLQHSNYTWYYWDGWLDIADVCWCWCVYLSLTDTDTENLWYIRTWETDSYQCSNFS